MSAPVCRWPDESLGWGAAVRRTLVAPACSHRDRGTAAPEDNRRPRSIGPGDQVMACANNVDMLTPPAPSKVATEDQCAVGVSLASSTALAE